MKKTITSILTLTIILGLTFGIIQTTDITNEANATAKKVKQIQDKDLNFLKKKEKGIVIDFSYGNNHSKLFVFHHKDSIKYLNLSKGNELQICQIISLKYSKTEFKSLKTTFKTIFKIWKQIAEKDKGFKITLNKTSYKAVKNKIISTCL